MCNGYNGWGWWEDGCYVLFARSSEEMVLMGARSPTDFNVFSGIACYCGVARVQIKLTAELTRGITKWQYP